MEADGVDGPLAVVGVWSIFDACGLVRHGLQGKRMDPPWVWRNGRVHSTGYSCVHVCVLYCIVSACVPSIVSRELTLLTPSTSASQHSLKFHSSIHNSLFRLPCRRPQQSSHLFLSLPLCRAVLHTIHTLTHHFLYCTWYCCHSVHSIHTVIADSTIPSVQSTRHAHSLPPRKLLVRHAGPPNTRSEYQTLLLPVESL